MAEHPDVFSDPNFSLTQLDSKDCYLTGSWEQQQQQQQDQRETKHQDLQEEQQQKEEQQRETEMQEMEKVQNRKAAESEGVGEGERQWDSDGADIPDDPSLAESHYSQVILPPIMHASSSHDCHVTTQFEDDFEELSSSEVRKYLLGLDIPGLQVEPSQ